MVDLLLYEHVYHTYRASTAKQCQPKGLQAYSYFGFQAPLDNTVFPTIPKLVVIKQQAILNSVAPPSLYELYELYEMLYEHDFTTHMWLTTSKC